MSENVTLAQVFAAISDMRGDIGEMKGEIKQLASQEDRIRKLERNQYLVAGGGTAIGTVLSMLIAISQVLPR